MDFILIKQNYSEEFVTSINAKLVEGYSLSGTAFYANGNYCQAMTKETVEEPAV